MQVLDGCGDASKQWEELISAIHVRRRLTEQEAVAIGPALDLRGTMEAKWRAKAMGEFLMRMPPHLLDEELKPRKEPSSE